MLIWDKTVKSFISNTTNRNESDIILIENNKVIKDRKNVANTLNTLSVLQSIQLADKSLHYPVKTLRYPFLKSYITTFTNSESVFN